VVYSRLRWTTGGIGLLLRRLPALVALLILSVHSVLAATASNPAAGSGPDHRTVNIASLDGFSVGSYYRQAPGDRYRDDAATDGLWGLQADSRLPVSNARVRLDYAMWVPSGNGRDGLIEPDHRMFRLQFDDHHGSLSYGARMYSVGQAFPHEPLARDQMKAAGLPGPGTGMELWAARRLPILGLRPTVGRLQSSNGNATTERNVVRVSHSHPLGPRSRINGSLESSSAQLRFDGVDGATNRDLVNARLEWTRPGWTSFLRNARMDIQTFSGAEEMWSEWELGTSHTLPARYDTVTVGLHFSQRRTLAAARPGTRAVAAEWAVRAPLRLWEGFPPGSSLMTSLGYHDSGGAPGPADGLSVRFDFNLAAGR
jgi:hypothetical protein